MRRILAVVLAVVLVSPAVAGLIGVPEAVPTSADFVVALSIGPDSLVKNLSSLSFTPKRADAVLSEHVGLFAKEWGIDLNGPFSLVVAGPQGKPDEILVSGQVKVDIAALSKTLKAHGPKQGIEIKESPQGLVISQKAVAVLVKNDGTFVGGHKERVKAMLADAKAGSHAPAPLAEELTARAGENATFAALVSLPKGIPAPPPQNVAGQPIAALWTRVRGGFAALKEKEVMFELTFDDPDAAKAGEPIISGWIKTLEGAVGTQVASAEQAARAKSPVNYLDPAWVGAKMSLETLKELSSQLAIRVEDRRLALALPRDVFQGGAANPVVMTAVVGVLAAIAVPNFKAARERANNRACFANQKTLVGATEMYNLDKNTKVTQLTVQFLQELKTGGYLQSIPQDPGQGPGTEGNYYFTEESPNGIACKVHGSIDGKIPPAPGAR